VDLAHIYILYKIVTFLQENTPWIFIVVKSEFIVEHRKFSILINDIHNSVIAKYGHKCS